MAHFERFPRIPVAGKSDPLTPDFTVLFTDNTAIVGEIAKLALHPGSADDLCRQIGGYAELTQVPDGRGGLATVKHLDVLQLVHQQVVNRSVKEILVNRFENPDHFYKPPRRPCVVGFSRTDKVYIFNRHQGQSNGTLYRGTRSPNIADFLDDDLKPPVDQFTRVKVQRRFMNDPVPPLYLATYLWTTVWARAATDKQPLIVNPSEVAATLRSQYGVGRTKDVKNALELLRDAKLATLQKEGRWKVQYRLLGRGGDREVHRRLAQLLDRPATSVPPRRRSHSQPSADQLPLW